MDYYWVKTGSSTQSPFRYGDFNIGHELRTNVEAESERKDWLGTAKERLNKLIATDSDAIVAGLYEYWRCYEPVFPQKTVFIPFPIDCERINDRFNITPPTAKYASLWALVSRVVLIKVRILCYPQRKTCVISMPIG